MKICSNAGWRWAKWTAGILAFAIYLWKANEWVVHLLSRPDEQIIFIAAPLESLPFANQFTVDGLEVRPDTRLQMVSLNGWILPIEKWRVAEAMGTHCEIVLASKEITYRLIPQQEERRDVKDIFSVENTNILAGYRARFSPVAMKKGIYRMGLVVCTETNDQAVAWTSFVFIHDRRGFRLK